MPTVTLGTYFDEQVTLEMDYDANNRVTAFRCINLGATRQLVVNLGRSNGTGPRYTRTFEPGTTTLTVPTTAGSRIQLTLLTADGRIRIDGLDGQIEMR